MLEQLPAWGFAFVLVLCRCSPVVMLLPGFGEAEVPTMVRAGLALAVTLLLLPLVVGGVPPAPPEPGVLLAEVATESLIGLLIGFLTSLLVLALPVAGQLLSYMLGMANVLQPDSLLGGESTPVAKMFGMIGPVLFMAAGLYQGPLGALGGSYRLFPLGGLGGSPISGDAVGLVVVAVSGCFGLAVRLAAPFILLGTVWQVALGLFSRLVPQLQIHSLAMPGQILGGLALLGLLAGALLRTWESGLVAGLGALPGM